MPAQVGEVPTDEWCSLGFTYDAQYIRAYINGVLDVRPLDPVKDGEQASFPDAKITRP